MRYTASIPYAATSSGNLATTASCGGGLPATVTLSAPASSGLRRFISDVAWSYSTTPSSGELNIYNGTSSGALVFTAHITAQGLDSLSLNLGGTPGNAITVQLLQAGSSIIGRLQAYGRID